MSWCCPTLTLHPSMSGTKPIFWKFLIRKKCKIYFFDSKYNREIKKSIQQASKTLVCGLCLVLCKENGTNLVLGNNSKSIHRILKVSDLMDSVGKCAMSYAKLYHWATGTMRSIDPDSELWYGSFIQPN